MSTCFDNSTHSTWDSKFKKKKPKKEVKIKNEQINQKNVEIIETLEIIDDNFFIKQTENASELTSELNKLVF